MTRTAPTSIYQSPPDQIAESALEHGAKIRGVPAGHVILKQGETAAHVYLLRRGLVCAAIEMNGRKLTDDHRACCPKDGLLAG